MEKEPFLDKLKLAYIMFLRVIGHILFILPVKKNRVLFESFSGDGYNCNPKYISQRLLEKYTDQIEVIWALKDEKKCPEGAIFCKWRSFDHFIKRITSRVYVCNYLQAIEIPKRKTQTEVQTWHGGGCYKKVGSEEKARGSAYVIRRQMHVKETDYFITSSKYWEDEVMRKQFGYTGNALEIGMPRNDCLKGKPDLKRVQEIRRKAGIEPDSFAVLYAPTWREGLDKYDSIDYMAIREAFEKRFGKETQMLFRAHVYGKEKVEDVLDLTSYPDMQELLYACDALITDYSSSMWDFSITEKPCFLYVPDLQRYIDQRGFDMDINQWGFPVCETNQDLDERITGFSVEDHAAKMRRHQQMLGSFENGDATDKVIELIASLCGQESGKD